MKFIKSRNQKIFCIGRNKTGTTSIWKALQDLGYNVAPQKEPALLIQEWAHRDFKRLIRFCKGYEAFQDAPFSYHFSFQAMDAAFPDSKFILTVRNSADEWYNSLIRSHAKIFGKKSSPSADELKDHIRYYRGRMWDGQFLLFGINEATLYNEKIYKDHYIRHNENVIDYFRHRENDLLVLNVSDDDAYSTLCCFLGKKCPSDAVFPWENRT